VTFTQLSSRITAGVKGQ